MKIILLILLGIFVLAMIISGIADMIDSEKNTEDDFDDPLEEK